MSKLGTKEDWCLLLNVPNVKTPIPTERLEALERILHSTRIRAINELLALHNQERSKINSQCDTLINMSTVIRYLEGLG